MTKPHQILWAKTTEETLDWHPLICHMIDTGQVASILWGDCLAPATRQYFASRLGLDESRAGALISFWVSLHDLGKAGPGFQRKHAPAIPALENAGFAFPMPTSKHAPHGVVSAWALEILLQQQFQLELSIARRIARALGGHHGSWVTSTQLLPQSLTSADKGDGSWDAARQELMNDLAAIFHPPHDFSWTENQEEENSFLVLFSGMTSVADWIGSMSEFFRFQNGEFDLHQYSSESRRKAMEALEALGWRGWQAEGESILFENMFPFLPNTIQGRVIEEGQEVQLPALLILEAPTGSGKTEAALYLADHWLQASRGRGLYVAMPTQATSNQMYERVGQFLQNRYSGQQINLHLAHGASLLAKTIHAPANISDNEHHAIEGGIRAETWFLPRKRTLLAPFGVGTVDQAFMSVLQTRHFFVRMFGLGQKVVIFDEVHAYDTYMSELFQQLLTWLRAIGTSVILLSATLPESTRHSLVEAWGGVERETQAGNYPRVTIATPSEVRTTTLPWSEKRVIHLRRVNPDPQSVVPLLKEKLEEGGCAAVICNRVARSREIFRAIGQAGIVDENDLLLFHARFPLARRMEIEKAVLERFGKGGERPKKSIVIATQVIEQSLDLDFDFMISDLAPVDLLLQRAGRLHRHEHNRDLRPGRLHEPELAITQPAWSDEPPDFGKDEWVYERAILLRTWAVLKDIGEIAIPDDTSTLIEAVYGDLTLDAYPIPIREAISKAEKKANLEHQKDVFEARKRLIPRLGDPGLIFSRNENLEEDDPTIHQSLSALTRLGEPSVSLACLYQVRDGVGIQPDGDAVLPDVDGIPDDDQIRKLLLSVVSVQDRPIYQYYSQRTPHPAWNKIAALRYIHPIVFNSQGRAHLEDFPWTLVLDHQLGFWIEKEDI